jgi:hypothetical protein
MQESRDVLPADWKVFEHLKDGDGLRHAHMNGVRAMHFLDPLDAFDDMLE